MGNNHVTSASDPNNARSEGSVPINPNDSQKTVAESKKSAMPIMPRQRPSVVAPHSPLVPARPRD